MTKLKSPTTLYINCLYIILTIIWVPLQKVFLHFDGAGRTIMIASFFIFLYNLNSANFRRILKSRISILWFVWIIIAFVNTVLHDSPAVQGRAEMLSFVAGLTEPYILMLCTAYTFTQNRKLTLLALLVAVGVYTFIGAFMMEGGLVYGSSILGADNLGNDLALHALFLIALTGLLFYYKVVNGRFLIVSFVFVLGLVFILAERKALLASFVIILFFIISVSNSYKTIILLLCSIVLMVLLMWPYISKSLVVERISGIKDYSLDVPAYLLFLGDRVYYYLEGFKLFVENPVTGIGLENFMVYTGYNQRIHSEIMVQITECGLIGFLLYCMFYISIFKSVLKEEHVKRCRSIRIFVFGIILAILFISTCSWTYDGCIYFVFFGLCIAFGQNSAINYRNIKIQMNNEAVNML